jgi:hypothetical protein
MPFREINYGYSKNYKRHMTALCRKNANLVNVEARGT